jgi:hypothetical protein
MALNGNQLDDGWLRVDSSETPLQIRGRIEKKNVKYLLTEPNLALEG